MKRIFTGAVLLLVLISASANALETSYASILANPAKYVGKVVTVTGVFAYNEPVRESFMIYQNGSMIEIFYKDLAKADRDHIQAQKPLSKASVTVTGTLHRFTNSTDAFFMNASSVSWAR